MPALALARALALALLPLCSAVPLAAPRRRFAAGGAGEAGSKLEHAPPTFFNSFSEGESTYDADADHGRRTQEDGWAPTVSAPVEAGMVDPQWFHESASAGPDDAWQTHYPALQTGLAGHGASLGAWERGPGGGWQQTYVPEHEYEDGTRRSVFDILNRPKELGAPWFDAAVAQVDTFGRRKAPNLSSPRRYYNWEERSVNTTLTCADPGCEAAVQINAFDGTTQRARNCRLSVYVTPTDYGADGGGVVEWISVNGANVSHDCAPPMSACDADTQRQQHSCALDISLDKLVTNTGTFRIAGKISSLVDECAYEGSLLYAVPMVTCLVQDQVPNGPAGLTNYPETTPEPAAAEGGDNATNATASANATAGSDAAADNATALLALGKAQRRSLRAH